MKRDRDNHKVQYLNQQRVELESRIDTVLEMLMVQRTPKQKWIISKYNKMRRRYNKLAVSTGTSGYHRTQAETDTEFSGSDKRRVKTEGRKNKNRLAQNTQKNSSRTRRFLRVRLYCRPR